MGFGRIDTLSWKVKLFQLFFFVSRMRPILHFSKFFISETTPFQKRVGVQNSMQKVRNVVSFAEYGEKLQIKSVSFNPFMPSGFFYLNSLDRSISSKRSV